MSSGYYGSTKDDSGKLLPFPSLYDLLGHIPLLGEFPGSSSSSVFHPLFTWSLSQGQLSHVSSERAKRHRTGLWRQHHARMGKMCRHLNKQCLGPNDIFYCKCEPFFPAVFCFETEAQLMTERGKAGEGHVFGSLWVCKAAFMSCLDVVLSTTL